MIMMRLFFLMVVCLMCRNEEGIALDSPLYSLSSSDALQSQPPLDLTDPFLVFISEKDEPIIHVMNYLTQKEVTQIKLERKSCFMTFTPDGGNLLIWDPCNHTISILNVNREPHPLSSINVGQQTRDLKVIANSHYALGVHCWSNSVSVINLQALQEKRESITVGQTPYSIQLTLDERYALVNNYWDHSISVINLQTMQREKDILVKNLPSTIQMTSDGKYALVAYHEDQSISFINLQTLQWEKDIQVNHKICTMQMILDGKHVLVKNYNHNSLSVINLYNEDKKYRDIPLQMEPHLLYVLNKEYALVGNCGLKYLQMINLHTTEITQWDLDFYPYHIATFPLSAIEEFKKQNQQNNIFRLQQNHKLTDILI
jgi:DNA-binding beta-propeller fold protein YncE